MGRGSSPKGAEAVASRASAEAPEAMALSCAELLEGERSGEAAGELISYRGEEIEITAEDPQLLLRGLAQVASHRSRGDGLYEIHFEDGSKALVDLDRGEIAFSSGDEHTPAQRNAAICLALAERSWLRDEEDEHLQHLADALAHHRDSLSADSLKLLAEAGLVALKAEDRGFTVNPQRLYGKLRERKRTSALPRAREREQMRHFQRVISKALEKNPPEVVAQGLFHHIDSETGEVRLLPEDKRRERLAAAEELGGKHLIPESQIILEREPCGKCSSCKAGKEDECLNEQIVSKGEYYVGPRELEYITLTRNRYAMGERLFILRGPPGSGKDEFMRQVAAGWEMPYQAFNIGPGFSIEDLIGSDGLGAHEARDENGELVNVISVSDVLEGPLARMAQLPSVAVIQEAAGMKFEMVRLHSLAGDRVGDPNQRYLTINSAKGRIAIPVHPDFVLGLTYNAGEEDEGFGDALHDRGLNLDFDYPSLEEECRRYALQAKQALEQQNIFPELKKAVQEGELTPEVVRPAVEVIRMLRTRSSDMVRRTPGMRQGVKFLCDIIMSAAADEPQAVDTALKTLHYTLPGPESGMDFKQRDTALKEILRDHIGDDKYRVGEVTGKRREKDIRDEVDHILNLDSIAEWARSVNLGLEV